jgi:N-acetylmuramoyl-L-alanine amidase
MLAATVAVSVAVTVGAGALPASARTHSQSAALKPLAGIVVGIDPGHNGRNGEDPSFLNRQVWNGHNWEDCDTTGTSTDSGYTEALFNWTMAVRLRAALEALGARVVLTRGSNHGVGPCVTTRAQVLDNAHVDVALDLHADGGPPSGRGFTVLIPVRTRWNEHVLGRSDELARYVRSAFLHLAKMPWSTYDGVDGLEPRDDLAGLNLTTVPKVLLECGNMKNATDASLLESPSFQRRATLALVVALEGFLRAEHRIAA